MNSIGPGSLNRLIFSKSLSDLSLLHTKYISDLPLFYQYVVWRYTIGSGQVNINLIFNGDIPDKQRARIWVYQFFKYFNYSTKYIPDSMKPIFPPKFVKNPRLVIKVKNMSDSDVNTIIKSYTEILQRLIYDAPVTPEDVIVYKASSDYPGLPQNKNDFPKLVPQLPFNSTSYDPQFNYGLFTGPSTAGHLFEILIPKGSHVLFINPAFHAYPFENEILLPHSVSFNIKKSIPVELDFVSKENTKLHQIQDLTDVHIGPVFRLGYPDHSNIEKRQMNLFITELKTL